MRTFNGLVLAVSWATASLGALYTKPSQLPHLTYDYVIVGGEFLDVGLTSKT